jgi:hypothetical protein
MTGVPRCATVEPVTLLMREELIALREPTRRMISVRRVREGSYFLEPMLNELGLGTLLGRCDRLASDEPEALLTGPT